MRLHQLTMARHLVLMAMFAFCGLIWAKSAQAERPNIVSTTAQLADMIREIGGDQVTVTSLMGEGVDPHTYRQTRRDIALMRNADLIVANGLYLEAQLESLLETLADQQSVILLGELLPPSQLLRHATYTGKYDPHIWMDVGLWGDAMIELAAEMGRLWPELASSFTAKADNYYTRLMTLDRFVEQIISSIPDDARVLITAHDAFQYFSRAYNIDVEGIQGLSTESEAGLKRVEDLVSLIVDRGIGAVFVESSVADRNVRALVEGAAAQSHPIVIGGSLFSDAMGAPGTYEGTYIGMLDHNATTIAVALGGKAPERGLSGQLNKGS